jgi:Phage gp6-like head-tail connector protein
MNTEEVKRLLGITTDKQDVFITEMLLLLTEFVKDYTNNKFETDGEEVLPGGVKLFIARAIQYNMNPTGVTGRSMGGASYSYDTDYPPSLMRLLRPYKRVRFI